MQTMRSIPRSGQRDRIDRPVPGTPRIHFGHNTQRIEGFSYHGFEYEIKRERGLDCNEDLYNPFTLVSDRAEREVIIASAQPHDSGDYHKLQTAS